MFTDIAFYRLRIRDSRAIKVERAAKIKRNKRNDTGSSLFGLNGLKRYKADCFPTFLPCRTIRTVNRTIDKTIPYGIETSDDAMQMRNMSINMMIAPATPGHPVEIPNKKARRLKMQRISSRFIATAIYYAYWTWT